MNESYDNEGLAYRKKKFAIEVKPASHPQEAGEMQLATTTNGYQWFSLCLLRSEAEAVIKALREHMTTPASEPVPEGTPETEQAIKEAAGKYENLYPSTKPFRYFVFADFARRLETERNAALHRAEAAERALASRTNARDFAAGAAHVSMGALAKAQSDLADARAQADAAVRELKDMQSLARAMRPKQ